MPPKTPVSAVWSHIVAMPSEGHMSAACMMCGRGLPGAVLTPRWRIMRQREEAKRAGDEEQVRLCDIALMRGEDCPEWSRCLAAMVKCKEDL